MEEKKTSEEVQNVKNEVPRRRLLEWVVGVINVGVFAAILGPTVGFILSPLKRGKEKGVWVPVLDANELQDGETKRLIYELEQKDGYMKTMQKYVLFIMRKGSTIYALDPVCPHLGCLVAFKEREQEYVCPCHGGTFNAEGKYISGPPPHGLTRYPTKIKNSKIWIYKV